MAALPSAFAWTPQDDLLLLNSVQAGASFESLANGVVQFSRRYTVQELHDRWLNLPFVSAQASPHMVAFGSFDSTRQSMSNTFDHAREVERNRSGYYDMSQRMISNNAMNASNVVGGDGHTFDPMLLDSMLVDPVMNNIVIDDELFDFNVMSNNVMEHGVGSSIYATDGVNASSAFPIGQNHNGDVNSLEGSFDFRDFPNEIDITEGLFDHLPIFETGDLETIQPAMVAQVDDVVPNTSSVHDSQVFNPAFPDFELSFQNADYAATPPELPAMADQFDGNVRNAAFPDYASSFHNVRNVATPPQLEATPPQLTGMVGQFGGNVRNVSSSVYENQVFTPAFPDSASSLHNIGHAATPLQMPTTAGQFDDVVRNASSVYENQVFTPAFPDSASSLHNVGYIATPSQLPAMAGQFGGNVRNGFSVSDGHSAFPDSVSLFHNVGYAATPHQLPAMVGQFDSNVRNVSSVFTPAFPASVSSFHNVGNVATPPQLLDWSITAHASVPFQPDNFIHGGTEPNMQNTLVPSVPFQLDINHGGKELSMQNTSVAPVHDGMNEMDTSRYGNVNASLPFQPDLNHGGEEPSIQNTLVAHIHDGADKMGTSGPGIANVVNSSTNLKDRIPSDILKDTSPVTNEYIEEVSNLLLSVTNDERLFFTGLDGIETTDMSSFLLDTPYEDDTTNKGKSNNISKAPDQQLPIPDGAACPRDFVVPEIPGGVTCCTINTEVVEVSNNDNVLRPLTRLPTSSAPKAHQEYFKTPPISSVNDFSYSQTKGNEVHNFLTEQNGHVRSQISSGLIKPALPSTELGLISATNAEATAMRNRLEVYRRTIAQAQAAADAYREMSIAIRAGLAVLHGRHTKYMIRNTHVLLGITTDDVKVEIDLSKESLGGQISQWQAMLRMDVQGIFYLFNVGRCPIHVNNNQLLPQQRLILTSGALIKVNDIALRFELNRSQLRHYVENLKRSLCMEKPSEQQK